MREECWLAVTVSWTILFVGASSYPPSRLLEGEVAMASRSTAMKSKMMQTMTQMVKETMQLKRFTDSRCELLERQV